MRSERGKEEGRAIKSEQDREACYERAGERISEKRRARRPSKSNATETGHEHNTARQHSSTTCRTYGMIVWDNPARILTER
jgi:hypothetical protein